MVLQHDTTIAPMFYTLRSNEYTYAINNIGSHLLFELEEKIHLPNNVDAYINIDSFKFTNAFYIVNEYNNVFQFGLASGGYSPVSVSIEQKNYTISTLVSYLNTNVGNGFTFTYDEALYKITITNSQEFKLFAVANNILKVLGFSNELQESDANTLVSNQVINLLGVQMIYIQLVNLSYNSFSVKNSTSQNKNSILAIPVSAIQGDTQIYHSNQTFHRILDKSFNVLQIRISDENDNELNFNGTEWFLNLQFIFTYQKQYIKSLDLNDMDVPVEENKEQKQEGTKKK